MQLLKIFIIFFVYIYENGYKLQKEACERYQNLSEEEKEIMWKKTRYSYKNLSKEEKEKKHQYHRNRNKNLSQEEKKSWV